MVEPSLVVMLTSTRPSWLPRMTYQNVKHLPAIDVASKVSLWMTAMTLCWFVYEEPKNRYWPSAVPVQCTELSIVKMNSDSYRAYDRLTVLYRVVSLHLNQSPNWHCQGGTSFAMCTFYTERKRIVQIRRFSKWRIYPFSKSQSPGSRQARSRMKISSKAMMGELTPDRITVPSKITWYDGDVRLAGTRCWATRHCRSWRKSFVLPSNIVEAILTRKICCVPIRYPVALADCVDVRTKTFNLELLLKISASV